MQHPTQRPLPLVALASALVAVAGCSKQPESHEESPRPAEPSGPNARDTEPITPETPPSTAPDDPATQPADAPLPEDWPADVRLAPYMTCENVTRVRDDYMVTFHARGRPLAEVVEWFQAALTEDGWAASGETNNGTRAILAYEKNDRNCGITITNFVLDESMQRDEDTRGITIQTPAQP